MLVRARAVFHGRVQGVNFRANCRDQAKSMGLSGFVRNVPDGSVEAVFEGERSLVEECIDWNRHSQPAATVTGVDVEWGAPTGEFRRFEVRL